MSEIHYPKYEKYSKQDQQKKPGLYERISTFFQSSKRILKIADNICMGKLVFVLEGGYDLIALPFCVHAVINALLKEEYEPPTFENIEFLEKSKIEDITKIKNSLKKCNYLILYLFIY